MVARPTVWPIYMLAGLCFAISTGLLAMFVVLEVELSSSPTGDEALVLIPFLVGLAAIRAGRAVRARAADDAATTLASAAKLALRSRQARNARLRAEPPRLGNDPFRDPPARPPILVERPAPHPRVAPIVPGDPAHAPKLLT